MGIGLKNEDFVRPIPNPVSPVDPTNGSSTLAWLLLVFILASVLTAIACKMGWICKNKKESAADLTVMWENPDESTLVHT